MKKVLNLLLICAFSVALSSCNEFRHRDLFQITDRLVEGLYTEYRSYDLQGGKSEYTPDKEYKVMPIGRLINVRIEKVASDEEYESLIDDFKSHYKGNSHVHRVYRCQAGTIMIDCRK